MRQEGTVHTGLVADRTPLGQGDPEHVHCGMKEGRECESEISARTLGKASFVRCVSLFTTVYN